MPRTSPALPYESYKLCPAKNKHTKQPEGYLQWHAWAEKKSKTHRQIRCKTCKFLCIWVPKKPRKK